MAIVFPKTILEVYGAAREGLARAEERLARLVKVTLRKTPPSTGPIAVPAKASNATTSAESPN